MRDKSVFTAATALTLVFPGARRQRGIAMRSALHWFVTVIRMAIGILMLSLGLLFLRHACLSLWMADGLAAFPSLLFGVTLHLIGGGILCLTFAGFVKGTVPRRYGPRDE